MAAADVRHWWREVERRRGRTKARCCVRRMWWHECVRAGAASHVWVQAQRTEKGQRARSEPRTEAEPQRAPQMGGGRLPVRVRVVRAVRATLSRAVLAHLVWSDPPPR